MASANSSVCGSSIGAGSNYGKSDTGRSEAGDGAADGDQELLPKQATMEDAIYGVLYTLSKEKASSSFRTSILKLLVDFAQLIVFYVDPAFGWGFSAANVYDVLYNFQLQNPLKDFGFTVWFVTFCLLATVLCGSVGLCAYVAQNFKTGRFPHVWPIKLMRFFVAIFFTLFYVSTLGVFIMTFDCDFSAGAAEAVNRKFPTRKCLSGVMLPAGVVGMLLSITFSVIAFFMEQAESDQNPLFTDPLGQPSSAVNVRNMIGKTAISLLWVVLVDASKGLLALIMLFITSFLLFDVVRHMPYYYRRMNYVRAGLYTVLAWFSLLNMLMVYHKNRVQNDVLIFWLGTPTALGLGLGALYVRMRHVEKIQILFLAHAREALAKDKDVKVEMLLSDIDHEFWDPLEVELVSRLIRAKLKYQTRRRSRKVQLAKEEETALHLASQAALLIGLEQFPEETYLQILYGNFLICIIKDSALGYTYLERARGQHTTFEERLMIFTKDRERTQQLGDDSGAAKMDLVRYVEFQNSFSLIKKTHQLVLKSTQRFWQLLLRSKVTFGSLSKAFMEMDNAESKGDRTYKVMIERYPKSSKLLRSYGHFLEDVRNDPWRAQRYFSEADKLDEEENGEVDSLQGSDDMPADPSHIDDKKYAVLVIKPNGIIRIANEKFSKLFGYKSGDLVGKNVNILMPQPYSQQHNGYLKKYMATGKRSIMDVKQKLQGRHKKGHTFPINLLVSKVPGGSAVDDVNFMGIVIPRKDDDVVGVVNLSKSGIISAFNQACEQMFGYSSSEAPGKPFKRLLDKASVKAFEEAMGLAMATAGSNLERQLQGMHKSGKAFPVRVNMVADSLGGIVAKVESLDDAVGMITIDEVGQIRNANECVVQIFGHSSHELIDMNISQLMPRPYSMFHASYLKRYKSTKKSSVVGDPLGRVLNRVLNGLHKSGHQFAINLNVYSMEIANGSDEVLYSGRISLPKSGVDDVRTARCTIRNDGGIQQMAEHFEALYGVQPHTFIGCPLEELVAEFEPSEAGLVAALTALQPLENRRLTRQTSASSMGKASSEHEASSRSLRLDNSAADRRRGRPGGLSGRGVLSFGGTPILVFMTTEATMGPLANVVQMWAGHLMEGIIDITKGGIISRATFGVQILFGYHNDDLVGQNVSMLMPHSVAKHHDTFLKNYQEGGRGNLIGVRRIVDGKHHDGSALRLALEVCDTDEGSEVTTYRGEKAAFTARVVLSNDPVTETFLKVNGSDDEDANRCTGSGEGNGGGCAFAPGPPASPDPKDSGMGLEMPALKANPLATLIECDEREAPLLIEGDEREAPLTSLDGDDEGDEDGTPRPPAPVKFALDKYPDVGFLPTSSSSPNEALAQDEQANVGLIPALLTSPGPVTEGLSGDDSNLCWPSSKKQGGNCPFDSRGKDGYGGCPSAPASAASPQRDLVTPGGGCPLMASCGGRTLPLALQAQRRGGGGGCPFMSAETMDSHEADEFLRAQGCVVSDAPNSAGGPGPVVENYEHPDPSIDPQALAAAAAAAAASHARGRPPPPAPGIPALGAQKPRPPKLVRFLTPRQMQAMEEAEQEAGVDEPTEEETAYFQQQQMYATNDYDGYSIAPSPHGDEEYFGNGAGATTFLPGGQYADGGQFLPVDMDNCGPVPQTPYYPNPSLHPPGELPVHVQEGDGGQGNESDQSFNTEDEAAEALEKRKAKMRKEVTKAKKARRISKLLSSPKARRAMNQLRSHTKYVLVLLTALYITAFTIMQVLAQQHRVIMAKVETVSLMAGAVPISAIDARVLEAAHSGVLNVSKIDVQEELLRQAYIIEELGRKIYLGDGELTPPGHRVQDQFDARTFVVEDWIDANPMRYELVNTSLWDATKMYYQNTRRVVHDAELSLDMKDKREWRYLIRNGIERLSAAFDVLLDSQSTEATDDMHRIELIIIVVVVLNMAVFCLVMIHFWRLLHKVANERLQLYAVFVSIPRPIVMKLATKKISTGADDSDEGSDDEDAAMVKLKKEQQQNDALEASQAAAAGAADADAGAGAITVSGGILSRPSGGARRRPSIDDGTGVSVATVNNYHPPLRKGSPPPEEGPAADNLTKREDPSLRGGLFKAVVSKVRIIGRAIGYGGNQVKPEEREDRSGIRFATTGRTIDPKGSYMNSFLVPLVTWGCMTLVAFSLSYWQFEGTTAPTNNLAAAARVEVLATASRFYANDLVLVGSHGHVKLGNRTDDEEVVYLRTALRTVTEELYQLYRDLLLGGGRYELDGSLYTSPDHLPLLFDHTCMRLAGEHHAPPCAAFGHTYYYRTMFGLDNLVKHYREECLLLALEPRATLTPNNTRYQFVWEAGKYDLRGGLRTNTHLYKPPPASDQLYQIAILVLLLLAEMYFVRYVFMPWWGPRQDRCSCRTRRRL